MVIINVTVPALISAAEGIYSAVSMVASSKVPVPEVVHVELVALPPRVADKMWLLPEQMFASVPAFTDAAVFIVNTIASLADTQGPAGSFVVIVKVTVPEEISAADGV